MVMYLYLITHHNHVQSWWRRVQTLKAFLQSGSAPDVSPETSPDRILYHWNTWTMYSTNHSEDPLPSILADLSGVNVRNLPVGQVQVSGLGLRWRPLCKPLFHRTQVRFNTDTIYPTSFVLFTYYEVTRSDFVTYFVTHFRSGLQTTVLCLDWSQVHLVRNGPG